MSGKMSSAPASTLSSTARTTSSASVFGSVTSGHVRVHGARKHAVHADALRRELTPERLRHRKGRGLGRRVAAEAGHSGERGDAQDIDHGSGAVLFEGRQTRTNHPERAKVVRVHLSHD